MTRIPSLIQILFLEFVAIFCLGSFATNRLLSLGLAPCPAEPNPIHAMDVGMLVVGLAIVAAFLWRTMWPTIGTEHWRPTLNAGSVIVTNPTIPTISYAFPSTHPSYALIDAFAVAWGWLFYSTIPEGLGAAGCGNVRGWLIGRMFFFISFFFPIYRLFAWYVLGRRTPPDPDVVAPVKWIYIIISPLAAILFLGYGNGYLQRARRPLVDEQRLAGGLSQHPELVGKEVRLRGVRKMDQAVGCHCDKDDVTKHCATSAVLVDLGAGGEVVIHSNYSLELFEKARGTVGSMMPLAYGVLGALPDPKDPKNEYQAFDCGWSSFGPPPPAGRAFLEINDSF